MERAGEILPKAVRRLARQDRPLDWLLAVWPVVMGKRLAAQTRPLACREGVLEVGVAKRDWRDQLEEMADTMRWEINRWWGGPLIRQIKFLPEPAAGASMGAPGRAEKLPGGASNTPLKPPVQADPPEERLPFLRRGAQKRRTK